MTSARCYISRPGGRFSFCGVRETTALLAERLRSNVRPSQSVSELTMSAASALSDHHATHAQLIQSDTHPPFKVLHNVFDSNRSALKRIQNERRQPS